jgi:hypothetical protein
MNTDNKNPGLSRGNLALGAALIIVGGLFLLGQLLDIDVGSFTWPFFIILPGLLLFVFALVTEGTAGEGVAILGSIVTMTGVVLLYQNTFNHFQSWAYAWALVIPTSIGLGRMVYGSLKGQPQAIQGGQRLVMIGGIMFLVGAVFFELIIGISGFGLGGIGWPILLIGLGAFFILRNYWPGASTKTTQAPAETVDSIQQPAQLKETAE